MLLRRIRRERGFGLAKGKNDKIALGLYARLWKSNDPTVVTYLLQAFSLTTPQV